MKKVFVFIVVFSFSHNTLAQWESEWFPTNLNIQSFTSNILEARTGFMFAFGEDRLRLDIGTSRDILHCNAKNETFSFGADLFTYTKLSSEDNFKFPVETIDYFFGLNAGYKKFFSKKEIGVRLRFSHISTHLVDGRYDDTTGLWLNGMEPFVYSKEFIDLFPYYRFDGLRFYFGITYIIHVIPENISRGIYQAGFDYYLLWLGNESCTPFIAYDFKLTGIDGVYSGNSIAKLGIKLGDPFSKGFSILLSYISGKSIHGQFFDLNEDYLNLGFNLDI